MKKIEGSYTGVDIWEKSPYAIDYEVAFKMKGITKIIRIPCQGIEGYWQAKAIAKALKASKLVQGIKVFGINWFYRFKTAEVPFE